MELAKPIPVPTPTSAPFWAGLREGKVRLQRCGACRSWVFYPRHRCPRCLSDALEWHSVSGNGTLVTFTIARQPTAPQFADQVPQKLAVVELEEGVRLTTTLVGVEERDIRVGMRVKPSFDPVSDEITLLRYRPA
jgi:hypothetical protein